MEQTKVIGIVGSGPTVTIINGPEPINYTITMFASIDYDVIMIDEEAIEEPLVPLKQLAAYSHKPKGVKRLFKPQHR